MAGLRLARLWIVALPLFLTGCLFSSSGDSPAPGTTVQLSGLATYDYVPISLRNVPGGQTAFLDYQNTVARPSRGAQIEAVGDDGQQLASARTGADGRYVLTVPKNTHMRLRITARLYQAPGNGPSWDFKVRDNTSTGYPSGEAAIYAVQGDAFQVGTADVQHNLHAASGWTGTGYGKPRSAAPLAILDQIYTALQKMLAVDSQAVFEPMNAYWSILNRPAAGDRAKGEITTSHWDSTRPGRGLYILGAENVDTDEYDTAVVVHEWGHYFESSMSRSDSTGGNHVNEDKLDMRLAFGEGWGNALAGMVRDDPIYVDTSGVQQAQAGLMMNLAQIPDDEPKGWFNEASVQTVLYQLYKSPQIGFAPIYRTMVGPQKNTEAFTSLYSFATYLRDDPASGDGAVDALLAGIYTSNGVGLDIWGDNQTYPSQVDSLNDPARTYEGFVLPVYTPLADGQLVTLCSTTHFGVTDGVKLGNFRYLRLTIGVAGTYQLTVTPTAGVTGTFNLYQKGKAIPLSFDPATHQAQITLQPGTYTADLTHSPLGNCADVELQRI